MKSLEELAEIGHEAFTKVMGYTGHAWASLSDRTKAAKIAQTLAIIHEVLGAVTEEEAVRFAKEYETNIQNREGFQATPAAQAGLKMFLDNRLTHYTRTAKEDCNPTPKNVQSPPAIETNVAISDDEVERVEKLLSDLKHLVIMSDGSGDAMALFRYSDQAGQWVSRNYEGRCAIVPVETYASSKEASDGNGC